MKSKDCSQQLQSALSKEHSDTCAVRLLDFIAKLENTSFENRTVVSNSLEADEDYARQCADVEVYKTLIIESVLNNVSVRDARILSSYIQLVDERHEVTLSMADMIVADVTDKYTKER